MLERGNVRTLRGVGDVVDLMNKNFDVFAKAINTNEKELRHHIRYDRINRFLKYGIFASIAICLVNYIRQNEDEKREMNARILKMEARCTPIEDEGEAIEPANK